MKKLLIIITLHLILSTGIIAQNSVSTVLQTVDFKTLISKSDLEYHTPVKTAEEGLPIGNGVMGTLVWTTPSALRFQLNRVDVFANDATSNNFAQRHADYCGGVGFLDIDFSGYDEVFTGSDYYQTLSCYEAVTISGMFYGYVSSAATFDKDYDLAVHALDKLAKAQSTGYDVMLFTFPTKTNETYHLVKT